MSGEVVIELPDPDIERSEFIYQYGEYKLLLQQIAAKEELQRKL